MSAEIDRRFMEQAITLARKAEGATWPNPMVGAVLVKDGDVIATGVHERPGAPHAEARALRQAGERAQGSVCYVNLEPCSHTGRTAPCADALIAGGVAEVVYGVADPNPLVSGRGLKKLREAGVAVRGPVMEPEARALNGPFMIAHTEQRPGLTLKLALSLDGMLADAQGKSAWITGSAARKRVHQLRARHQAVMVGAGTFREDNPRLTPRDHDGHGQPNVSRVIIGREIPDLQDKMVFAEVDKHPVIFIVSNDHSEGVDAQRARDLGAQVLGVESRNDGRVDLKAAMTTLCEQEIFAVFCEGGAQLAAELLKAELVDRIHLFRAPIVLGSPGGKPGVGDLQVRNLESAIKLRRLCTIDHGDDLEEILVSQTSVWTAAP